MKNKVKMMVEMEARKAGKETPAECEARYRRDHRMSPAEFERMRKVLRTSVYPAALQRAEDEADEDEAIRRFARGH